MKKDYVTPDMEIIEIELEGMLAYSTGFSDDDANDPANAPLYDE